MEPYHQELSTAKYLKSSQDNDLQQTEPAADASTALSSSTLVTDQFSANAPSVNAENEESVPSGRKMSLGKLIVILIGVGIMGMGGNGIYLALTQQDEPPKERTDITTEGVVRDITVTQLKHKIGIVLDQTVRVEYAFEANDGEFYHGEEIIEEHEVGDLVMGHPIKVMYHSDNPSINAAPDYGHYVSVDDLPDMTGEDRLNMSLGVVGFGLLIALGGFFVVKTDEPSTGAA